MDKKLTPEQQLKNIKVVWFMMISSVLVYFAIGFFQAPTIVSRDFLANLVWGVAIVCIGMGFVLPNILLKRVPNDVPNRDVQPQFILRYAFFESVGVFALVNRLAHGISQAEFAAGILISFALLVTHPPKLS